MRRFWRRNNDAETERLLRRNRPQAPGELVRAVADDVADRSRRSRTSARLALAGSLTAILFAVLAGTGGLTYAAAGITGAIKAVTKIPSSQPTTAANNPSSDQYKPGKGCGDKNHAHERRHQCKAKKNDAKKTEGNSGTTAFVFTVSLDDAPLSAITVGYTTADGNAKAGEDYVPTAGTLTFAPGVKAQTITVSVIGDTVREANETFSVNLVSISANGVIVDPEGSGTIGNDDR